MGKKLVVFDLDGTLVNSIEDLGNAVNHALASAGLPQHSLEEYKQMVGHGVRNLVKKAMPVDLASDETQVDHFLNLFVQYYSEHIDVYTRPYPGIPELLSELNARGVKMAIASNKFQSGTERLAKEFFPDIPFVAIFGNCPGAPLKPDPQIVQTALERSGVEDLSDAVMVGDSATDIATGHNACIASIAVSWGFRSRQSLQDGGADVIVDTVAQLAEELS